MKSLLSNEVDWSKNDVKQACNSCGANCLSLFFEARNTPVHCNVMTSTKQEALSLPTGDIILGFCKQCGFITNVAFDPKLQDFSTSYEDQQSFSPTFKSFSHELANRLIQKYDLHDKDVLEIGCGKGDFLVLLCELGRNRGVGIDPAFVKDRIKGETASHVRFIQDFFHERHAPYVGNFVICRHTLEHIQPTAQFLETVRRTIGDRLDTTVFFEVPDVRRILRELAFWDIYYEHCSYFSAGSLARLFRSSGFEVIDLLRAYDDQYLLIEAQPVKSPPSIVHGLEEDLQQMTQDLEYFTAHIGSKLEEWRERFQGIQAQQKRVVAWGSGSKCVSFLTMFDTGNAVQYVVDINPYRHGKFIPSIGKEIKPPEFLRGYKPDLVIVMNPIYRDEIQEMLDVLNVTAEVISV